MEPILIFISIYTILGLLYVWYQYILILSYRNIQYPENKSSVSIVVPVYNEDRTLFIKCINSILNTEYDGKKEIILIDDGSTNGIWDLITAYKKEYPRIIKAYKQPKNRGKRKAQARGIVESTGEIILTVDSDTILAKNSVKEIVKPFFNPKIGAVCGNILVLNQNENWLTKLTAAMYWSAFQMGRRMHASLGYMEVCSGGLSAYRKEGLVKIIDSFVHQHFYGQPVAIGDDRFLTQRFQTKLNYNIAFAPNAKAWTASPSSFKKFFIQLLRWRRSTIFESLYLILEFRKAKLLFIDSWFEILMTTLGIFVRIYFFWLMLIGRLSVSGFLFAILFVAFVNSSYILFFKKDYFVKRIGYTFLNELILWIIHPIALITVRRQNVWSSR